MGDTSMAGQRSAAETVRALMPALRADFERLVRIPSIAFPGFDRGPLLQAHELVAQLLRDAGVPRVEALSLPDTAPVVIGEIPAPPGAPTVLLYSHYDVVPGGDESLWSSPRSSRPSATGRSSAAARRTPRRT
jgi:acetylornithine deacetylase/succinyl-diaminopimelate desuccinylase-like protein